MTTKNPVGRPRTGNARGNRVSVQFTDDELASIEKAAGGKSMATWIREAALNAAPVPSPMPPMKFLRLVNP